ncbi:NAD(P)H-dependent oxidoreductase [Candidatus Woesearchaeota archaeon]|nr:NAD(P)H-dependent oxidoreductase [Candidatus Woesearchaeota archaeon]
MVKIVVIQGSLNQDSRTAIVVAEAVKKLQDKDVDHEVIDLRELKLQFCDGRSIDDYNSDMQKTYKTISSADGYIIGMPVYQYTVAGPLKNFIDIMNHGMYYKAVGMICNSGGIRSYLAAADMLKILSYELWTIMVQPTVHTWQGNFKDGELTDNHAREKLDLMIENVIRYAAVEPAKPD